MLPCELSFNVKKQFELLQSEYYRLGEPLKEVTLLQLVAKVDIELSRNETFVVQSGQAGPGGETQFLCNKTQEISWWLPKDKDFDDTIYKRADGVPFVFEKTSGKSVYCIDLQKRLMQQTESATFSSAAPTSVPLPGDSGPPSDTSKALPTTHGSVPLPGVALKSDGRQG